MLTRATPEQGGAPIDPTRGVHKEDITPALVARMVARQFPQWSELPVAAVALDGWDNTTFRLGTTMSVRLPSGDVYVPQIEKEHRWLPVLRHHLPLPIPEPLVLGEPDEEFPRPWSVYRWIDGDTASDATVDDPVCLAIDVAGFLCALYRCDPTGGPGAAHGRGGPVGQWDEQVRGCLERLGAVVDTEAAGGVWEGALDAPPSSAAVWVHGDVVGTNLLVRDGRLHAVIDFGCCAVGDPACDLTIAYTYFDGASRDAFTTGLDVDGATWARGRGWALWKALLELATDQVHPGHAVTAAQRMGWRRQPEEIVEEVIADHRQAG